jgi:hypothetical protein
MDKFSGKNKLIFLLVGFVFALILVYGIAVSNTISLWSKCKTLSVKIQGLEKAPEEIKEYKKKLDEINTFINKNDEKSINFHEGFLGFVSPYCSQRNIIIKEYPMPHQVENDKYIVETDIIRFEGEFSELLQLIYYLEKSNIKGHISSLMFETIPDHRTGVYTLNLTIYEQNIFDAKKVRTDIN